MFKNRRKPTSSLCLREWKHQTPTSLSWNQKSALFQLQKLILPSRDTTCFCLGTDLHLHHIHTYPQVPQRYPFILHFHFSLSCIGEGNGNPLQYSCLENPGDRGAQWAAIYGVAQSDTTEATQQQQQQPPHSWYNVHH